MWVLVTIPLVENLHKNGHTAQLCYTYSGRSVNTVSNLYVDDVDLVSVSFDPDKPFANVLSQLQGMVLTWHGGLRATGGDLKWTKREWCSAKFT